MIRSKDNHPVLILSLSCRKNEYLFVFLNETSVLWVWVKFNSLLYSFCPVIIYILLVLLSSEWEWRRIPYYLMMETDFYLRFSGPINIFEFVFEIKFLSMWVWAKLHPVFYPACPVMKCISVSPIFHMPILWVWFKMDSGFFSACPVICI